MQHTNRQQVPSPTDPGQATQDPFEIPDSPCLEVQTSWGDLVLGTVFLCPPRSYYLEHSGWSEGDPGGHSIPIVLIAPGSAPRVVVPPGADAHIDLPGQPRLSLRRALARGILQPCVDLKGAYQVYLYPGVRVRVQLRSLAEPSQQTPYRQVECSKTTTTPGLTVQIAWVCAARKPARALRATLGWRWLGCATISLIAHLGFLIKCAYSMPALTTQFEPNAARDQLYLFAISSTGLAVPDEEPPEPTEGEGKLDGDSEFPKGGISGEGGLMGTPLAVPSPAAFAVAGPADNPDPHVARALGAYGEWPTYWLSPRVPYGGDLAPNAPWGRDDSLGRDPKGARGHLTGRKQAEALGVDGLTDKGDSTGGTDPVEGTSARGTRRFGRSKAPSCEAATARDLFETTPPTVYFGAPTIHSILPQPSIRRSVESSTGRFRYCYEEALRTNPNLRGRVVVRAVLSGGVVSSVQDGGSDLPAPNVVQCLLQTFGTLTFSEAAQEPTVVVYPIVFSSGG